MKILITGTSGFIGSHLYSSLLNYGNDIITINRSDISHENNLKCDLLNRDETINSLKNVKDIDVLIHTAAIAHGESVPTGYNTETVNITMTKNLLFGLRNHNIPTAIFMSTISIYGLDSPKNLTCENPSPLSSYGRGKLNCEKLFLKSKFKKIHLLRLAPVFSENHLNDVKKRVYFPGQKKFKMKIWPSPKYSFLRLSNLIKYVHELLDSEIDGWWIHNVSDEHYYKQHVICEWFKGISIPFPKIFINILPLNFFLNLNKNRSNLYENIEKLFNPHTFKSEKIRLF